MQQLWQKSQVKGHWPYRKGWRPFKGVTDACIVVPEQETFKIQEFHLPVYHALCLMLEEYFYAGISTCLLPALWAVALAGNLYPLFKGSEPAVAGYPLYIFSQ